MRFLTVHALERAGTVEISKSVHARRSGLAHGLELILDTETYDNADPSAESDGFILLLKNAYEAPLVRVYFTVFIVEGVNNNEETFYCIFYTGCAY